MLLYSCIFDKQKIPTNNYLTLYTATRGSWPWGCRDYNNSRTG